MRVMRLPQPGSLLQLDSEVVPEPKEGQVLLRVHACGVCRTDLHVVDGELPDGKAHVAPGHQVVGTVAARGEGVSAALGERLGVPWLGWTCGVCSYCKSGRENLCDRGLFTGYTLDGGYADYVLAYEPYCLPIPESYDDAHAAPLLCAGVIGFRALRLAGPASTIGFYGFGAAAHILTQVAIARGQRVLAFTRPGDETTQAFARSLGAGWAGGSEQRPPQPLDAAILFAPVGSLVPAALAAVKKGGVVVAAGIHMSDIPSFPYRLLWEERQLRSVANLTREDGRDFMKLAATTHINTEVQTFSLEQANEALAALRGGKVHGAAVLTTGAT